MFIIYIPLVFIVLYYVLRFYFTRNFNYWNKRNVIGPEPVPIFGNLKESASRREYFGNVLKNIYETYPKEKVVGIYRMTTPALLIRDLDIIKHIMVKDFDLFKDRGVSFSKKGLGNNLFHTDGESWTILRSRFNPMFTPGKLKNMFHLINERSDVFISHLQEQCRKSTECEIYSTNQKYTLSTISACAFGVDFDPFVSEVHETLKYLDSLILTPSFFMELDMMYPGLLKSLNLSLLPARITEFFKKLVTDIMTQRDGKPSTRGDFMDLIISMRQAGEVNSTYNKEGNENKTVEITDDIIYAQAFVFYVGGYETSATTMSFLLYQLALNPEIQDKLREEINEVLKSNDGQLTYELMNEMKYLEKVFSETLRVYPIIDPLQRMVQVDYKIPGTDIVLEKNNLIYVSALGVHYDEKYYPNPEVFDPERFDPELVRTRHPCAYLPFGVGPRNCIGMRFGSIQARVGVAKILSNFRVEVCEKTEIPLKIQKNKIIMGPANGIHLNIIPL